MKCVDRTAPLVRRATLLFKAVLALALAGLLIPAGAWMHERAFADDEELIEVGRTMPDEMEVPTINDAGLGDKPESVEAELILDGKRDVDDGEDDEGAIGDVDESAVGAEGVESVHDEDPLEGSKPEGDVAPLSDVAIDGKIDVTLFPDGLGYGKNAIDLMDASKGGKISGVVNVQMSLEDEHGYYDFPLSERHALSCFTTASSDPSVATADVTLNEGSWPVLTITGHSEGSAIIELGYAFQRYQGSCSVPVAVLDEANAVTGMTLAASSYEQIVFEHDSSWLQYDGSFVAPEVIVDLEDPSLPASASVDELFSLTVSGNAVSGARMSGAWGSQGDSDESLRHRLYTISFTSVRPGSSTVTVSLRSDPSISASLQVDIIGRNPELSVSDMACVVGDAGDFDGALPDSVWNYLRIHPAYDERQAFVTNAISSDESVVRILQRDVSSASILETACPYTFAALKKGSSTITLTDLLGKSCSFEIVVASDGSDVVTSIDLSKSELTLKTNDLDGAHLQVAIVKDETEPIEVKWSSSDVAVAKIAQSDDGGAWIMPVGVGQCVVTVTAGSKAAACMVTVEAAKVAEATSGSDLQAEVALPKAPSPEIAAELKSLSLSVTKTPSSVSAGVDGAVDAMSNEDKTVLGVFDIHFVEEDGTEHAWGADKALEMDVRILMDAEMKALAKTGSLSIWHVDGKGDRVKMDSWIEGDYLVFRTMHFSYYLLVHDPTAPPSLGNGDGVDGEATQPPSGESVIGREPVAPVSGSGIEKASLRALGVSADLSQTGDDAQEPVFPLAFLCLAMGAVMLISLRRVCQES